MGNINQSVHLVGSHMADQHANSANLLIFSNGVQLIPLAAFISRSHTNEGRGGMKVREQRRVCCDSLLFLLNSFFLSLPLRKQRNQSQVINEVDMGALGSRWGDGGGSDGGWGGGWEKVGKFRRLKGGMIGWGYSRNFFWICTCLFFKKNTLNLKTLWFGYGRLHLLIFIG